MPVQAFSASLPSRLKARMGRIHFPAMVPIEATLEQAS